MIYREIDDVLESLFPALRSRLDRERRFWAPDPVGGDILLADIFVPYLMRALRGRPDPACNEVVERGARFIEDLATSDDRECREAARISVMQALEDHPKELALWVDVFHPRTRALLPTRRSRD